MPDPTPAAQYTNAGGALDIMDFFGYSLKVKGRLFSRPSLYYTAKGVGGLLESANKNTRGGHQYA